MRGLGRLKSAYRKIKFQFIPTGIILMYHRVVELESDPWGLAVKPDFFAQQLDYIKNNCEPMPLLDLAEAVRSNRLQKRSVSITFDDGYLDNLHFAYPLLKRYNIPATIFISSMYVDKEREYWWDELERLILVPKSVPTDLNIEIGGREYHWTLNSNDQRMLTYNQLHMILKAQDEITRDKALFSLQKWAGNGDGIRSYYRPLNSNEIRQLAQDTLIQMGSHTMTHSSLNNLPYKEQYAELKGSKDYLENLLKSPVLTLAYPHGAYNDETIQAAKEVGVQVACTTQQSYIVAGADCLKLPRFYVGNWDSVMFRKQIESFFIHKS